MNNEENGNPDRSGASPPPRQRKAFTRMMDMVSDQYMWERFEMGADISGDEGQIAPANPEARDGDYPAADENVSGKGISALLPSEEEVAKPAEETNPNVITLSSLLQGTGEFQKVPKKQVDEAVAAKPAPAAPPPPSPFPTQAPSPMQPQAQAAPPPPPMGQPLLKGPAPFPKAPAPAAPRPASPPPAQMAGPAPMPAAQAPAPMAPPPAPMAPPAATAPAPAPQADANPLAPGRNRSGRPTFPDASGGQGFIPMQPAMFTKSAFSPEGPTPSFGGRPQPPSGQPPEAPAGTPPALFSPASPFAPADGPNGLNESSAPAAKPSEQGLHMLPAFGLGQTPSPLDADPFAPPAQGSHPMGAPAANAAPPNPFAAPPNPFAPPPQANAAPPNPFAPPPQANAAPANPFAQPGGPIDALSAQPEPEKVTEEPYTNTGLHALYQKRCADITMPKLKKLPDDGSIAFSERDFELPPPKRTMSSRWREFCSDIGKAMSRLFGKK